MVKKVYIEITNICNRRCPFCPGSPRPGMFMRNEDFRRIIAGLEGKALCLYFHVMGEPLLHPQLGLFLDLAGEAAFPVNLTTNGTLLAAAGEQLLSKPALRQVNISLHSLNENEDDIRHLHDMIDFAEKAARQGRLLVGFRLWNEQNGEGNRQNDWIINRLAEAFGFDPHIISEGKGSRGVKLADRVFLNAAAPFQWPDLALQEIGGKGFCMGLRDQIGILCDGTVVPCCLDGGGAMTLGNILKQPLDEILSSPRAVAIYNGFSRREAVEELCRRCGYRRRFDK